eukprot:TRINITY_DN82485_c0_g1_i1.p1 TRINITY_DN82485_c0_g1~~TRINITY_DN82485_c0_g1_i1.p1  ORF type:complete len:218 (-),score=32.47 TRINITY_DN82485_c0_g1_i1:88-741(-)
MPPPSSTSTNEAASEAASATTAAPLAQASSASPAAAVSVPQSPPNPAPQSPPEAVEPQAVLAANILPGTSSQVQLMHRSLSQDPNGVGDATVELGKALQYFPNVKKAYRLGQIYVSRSKLDGNQVAITATLMLANTGVAAWPAQTNMRLVLGSGLGLYNLHVGQAVPPGVHIDLTLQLEIPEAGKGEGHSFSRSVWVMEALGEPFGPLLVLEVTWVD